MKDRPQDKPEKKIGSHGWGEGGSPERQRDHAQNKWKLKTKIKQENSAQRGHCVTK